MNSRSLQPYFVAAVLAATLAGGAYLTVRRRLPTPQRVAAHIAAWADGPRAAATVMTERYGPPNTLAPETAIWHQRGPWKRITVRADARDGYLEHAVSYGLPFIAILPLFEFGHGVRANAADNEMIASGIDEPTNTLALNLADEIATGKRTAPEAAEFYARTVRLARSGKSSPYADKLGFEPHTPRPEDSWRRVIGY